MTGEGAQTLSSRRIPDLDLAVIGARDNDIALFDVLA